MNTWQPKATTTGELQLFKGADLLLNEGVIEFLVECQTQLKSCYTNELHDTSPTQVLRTLVTEYEWDKGEDSRGNLKVWKSLPYSFKEGEEELRVTVVLNKGVLHLDIRPWGHYRNGGSKPKWQS